MNAFDGLVVLAGVVAAAGGWRLGFFTRALSWVGLAAGAYVAARFLPRIIAATGLIAASTRLVVAAAVLVAAALVGQAIGMGIGGRLQSGIARGHLLAADRLVGAATGAFGVLVALWLLLPAVSSVAGWPARTTRSSVIAGWVSRRLPPPPDTFQVLRRLVDSDGFPQVFADLRPDRAAGPPPAAVPLAAAVVSAVSDSTVQVQGVACSRIQDGSGFAVAPGLVLTNAHVVAGEPPGQTAVIEPSGRRLPATVVRYDPDRDVALLAVPGLDEAPLPLARGAVGDEGAVFGHPNGQTALAVQPARVASRITAVGEDLYGTRRVSRQVWVLAARLAPGDSGGALVDPAGRVIGVAFAIALDHPDTAYALTTGELHADLAAPRRAAGAATEGCVAG